MAKPPTEKIIIIASGNPGKIREFAALLEPLGFQARGLKEVVAGRRLSWSEPEETGDNFAANSEIKARTAGELLGLPVLADDSGLCVRSLQGEPGVRSARYGGPGLDDTGRCEYLLEKMRGLSGEEREAWFECDLCYYEPGPGDCRHFQGRAHGSILDAPRGEGGFGYDPLFFYSGPWPADCPADLREGASFAQIPTTIKNKISHRALAGRAFVDWLSKL